MIHIVIGTKAQLIKMAPVMRMLRDGGLPYRFISTGQHRDTMEDILANFRLPKPDYVLYQGSDITSIPKMAIWGIRILWKTLWRRREIFGNDRQGIVLVHGDTFSTLLGALMAKIGRLKVGHVESGLRSHNLLHPFPEEITRLLTFWLADYYFCPGDWAVKNVQKYAGHKINTGANTLADALHMAQSTIDSLDVDFPSEPYAIATLHRFENIYSRQALQRIVDIVCNIADTKKILFILHQPTQKKLHHFDLYQVLEQHPNIELRERYDYFRFIKLLSQAEFVISDGGSNQEECYYLGKPILLLRQATERQEGLGENCVLSHYDTNIIADFVKNYSTHQREQVHFITTPSEIIANTCKPFSTLPSR
ncbi:MAG: UDP-N-acetylglucosamine 2-epimerase [Methylobacillus sp.]|jgi:UDP-N-acetylglucosamine 2-epimerase (non-hydrolysing)|nr:UDP-N-acetylglucosamine 2-epimerase [Methylobacillus sp.]